jgi:hypothetical protein
MLLKLALPPGRNTVVSGFLEMCSDLIPSFSGLPLLSKKQLF